MPNLERKRAYQREWFRRWYKNNAPQARDARRIYTWKTQGIRITPSEYDRRMADQEGLCALCHKPSPSLRRLAVDHNHRTGQVRGLLCGPCNAFLGRIEDNPALLEGAIQYLKDDNV